MSELGQFCILAEKQRGLACAALIQQVLTNKKIFVFGELLSVPSVTALRDGEHIQHYATLELFAYGKYLDYKYGNENQYLKLNAPQLKKLRLLTLATLAEKSKILPYEQLLIELDLSNMRDLEDLIIEAVYEGIISGKIDQRGGLLRVSDCMARDVRPEELTGIIDKLTHWDQECADFLGSLAASTGLVVSARERYSQEQIELQKEADITKASIKDSVVSGGDGVGGGREWEGADDEEDAEEGIGGGRDEWTQSRRVLRQEGDAARSTKRNRLLRAGEESRSRLG